MEGRGTQMPKCFLLDSWHWKVCLLDGAPRRATADGCAGQQIVCTDTLFIYCFTVFSVSYVSQGSIYLGGSGRGVIWRDGGPNVQIVPINRNRGCSYVNVCPVEDSGAAGEQGRVRSPDVIMQRSPAVYKNPTWEGTGGSRSCPHLGDQVCTLPRSCVAAALTRTFLLVHLDICVFVIFFVNYVIGEIFDGILEHLGTYVAVRCVHPVPLLSF